MNKEQNRKENDDPRDGKKQPPPQSNAVRTLLVIGGLIALIYMFTVRAPIAPKPEELDYSVFVTNVRAGRVHSVKVFEHQNRIVGFYKTDDELDPDAEPEDPEADEPTRKSFEVNYPNHDQLVDILLEHEVSIESVTPGFMERVGPLFFTLALPIGIIVLLWMFFMRQAGGGAGGAGQIFSFGKSKAKLFIDNAPKVTFDDVAGVEEAKSEVMEIVEFLKDPRKFTDLGAKIPKGVLLVGPPGSGKTLLARAIAGEAGVPFFQVSGSDFVEMFVGVGASRVRDLFAQAMKHSPCLIFIDEIDAVGRQRGAGLGGGHDEREQTLNQLLVEMDGFDPNIGVIMLAATNRPDVLDPALLRPGRFDRRIMVDSPDLEGRREILAIHVKGKPLAPDIDLAVIARRTPGFNGADLENTANEAAILAARAGAKVVSMSHFEEAIDRVVAGPERRSRVISDHEKKVIAYHESGHALTARLLPNADPVHKVSILPRGMALGYTLQLPIEDRYLNSRNELMDRMAVMLGGRVAEQIVFQDVTTGAHNDLEKVTEIARRMITQYGMSENLGPITFGKKHETIFLGRDIAEDRNYSEEVAARIDREVRRFVDKAYAKARELLTANRAALDALVEQLMKQESIEGDELKKLLEKLLGDPGPDDHELTETPMLPDIEESRPPDPAPTSAPPPPLPTATPSPHAPAAQAAAGSPFDWIMSKLAVTRDFLSARAAGEDGDSPAVAAWRLGRESGHIPAAGEIPDPAQLNPDAVNLRLLVTLEKGLALLREGELDAGLKNLMNVAMRSAVSLEPEHEREMLSAIRFLKIAKEHLAADGVRFQELQQRPELLQRIRTALEDREAKLGHPRSDARPV